jgi:hypothetical protein
MTEQEVTETQAREFFLAHLEDRAWFDLFITEPQESRDMDILSARLGQLNHKLLPSGYREHSVLVFLHSNEKIAPWVMELLSHDDSDYVMRAVINHPSVPVGVFLRLLAESPFSAREAIAQNPEAPPLSFSIYFSTTATNMTKMATIYATIT